MPNKIYDTIIVRMARFHPCDQEGPADLYMCSWVTWASPESGGHLLPLPSPTGNTQQRTLGSTKSGVHLTPPPPHHEASRVIYKVAEKTRKSTYASARSTLPPTAQSPSVRTLPPVVQVPSTVALPSVALPVLSSVTTPPSAACTISAAFLFCPQWLHCLLLPC